MVNVSVQSRGVIIGIAIDASPLDCLNNRELDVEVRLRAIDAVKDTDAETLKESFIRGLIDAEAYPHDFTEIVG